MTQQTTEQAEAVLDPPPVQVSTAADPRLAQLHAAYATAKAAADEAAKRLKTITDALKVEATSRDPQARRFEITGDGPRLTLTYSESWRIDSTKLKREDPETWVRYAKKGGSWTLRAGQGGE